MAVAHTARSLSKEITLRVLYFTLGILMTLLGVVGAVLPLMPTTVFLILAVWFFGRSSPRFEAYLLRHPRLGPPLRDWRESGAISVRAKMVAVFGMTTSFAVFVFSQRPELLLTIGIGVLLLSCAAFVVSRPSKVALSARHTSWPKSEGRVGKDDYSNRKDT